MTATRVLDVHRYVHRLAPLLLRHAAGSLMSTNAKAESVSIELSCATLDATAGTEVMKSDVLHLGELAEVFHSLVAEEAVREADPEAKAEVRVVRAVRAKVRAVRAKVRAKVRAEAVVAAVTVSAVTSASVGLLVVEAAVLAPVAVSAAVLAAVSAAVLTSFRTLTEDSFTFPQSLTNL